MKRPGSATDDPAPRDDSALVEACLQGDAEAWAALISRYERLIYSIPVQAGMSRADAAEVFQAVCIKLLRKLSTLRDQQRLAAWLITTTSRECWRLSRHLRRDRAATVQSQEDDAYDLTQIAAALPLPDEEQALLEEQQMVREAVSVLPERCRDLITLLFLQQEEPAYEEVARRLNMPVSSIGPTRARCLAKLKKILEGKM